MTKLTTLYDDFGLSPWIDNLQRSWLLDGTLSKLIDQGVRGLTSNPTIFANAISKGEEYAPDIAKLKGKTPDEAYWTLVLSDISQACDLTHSLFRSSNGNDGFISIEVDPRLARKTSETIDAAKELSSKLNKDNLFVKVPATTQGVQAFREITALGISVNVTLIFSIDRYREVMAAYLDGLEALATRDPAKLGSVHSVASFFISRTDTKVDAALAKAGAEHLGGKAAVSQAKLAYQEFLATFATQRWLELQAQGANLQRPLWASTSTKNPAYPDLLYVEELIGPNCVNTMPQATLEAYLDHGQPSQSLIRDVQQARSTLEEISALGIDLAKVSKELEDEGVDSFEASHESILELLRSKVSG